MNSITFTCEVVTPMFLAGADGKTPELRPPSIKGAMRFWWRALHGDMAIEKLKEKENKIFGGGGDNASRSKINIRISHFEIKKKSRLPVKRISMPLPKQEDKDGSIAGVDLFKYLSYGAERREYIDVGFKFEVIFTYRDDRISIIGDIVNPFYALSFFGGLGAKSRNGFGSFKINECSNKNIQLIVRPEEFIKSLPSESLSNSACNYTAFSKAYKLLKTEKPQGSWESCLAVIGGAYAIEKRKLDNAHHYNKRAYIAAPIMQSKVHWHKERHAKQYFLSITNSNGAYTGWILFLPYLHRYNTNTDSYHTATDMLNNGLLHHELSLVTI